MTIHEFIFSDQKKYRLGRHIIFWILFSLHFIIQNLMIGGAGEGSTSRTFLESASHFLYFLPIYLISTYFFINILLQKLLFKKRYVAFVFSFLLLFTINFTAVYYSGKLYLHHQTGQAFNKIPIILNKYHAVVDGLFVPFMLFGIVTGIKFSKKWFLQQRENDRLAKQKLATELQLLKTSIHPRFLFHSLHTVEKHIERSSSESPALILQLSDLLSYVLYENDKNWVELEKELEIIRGYINLEKKGFESKFSLETAFPANSRDTFIAPCILLSFVESCFEYFLATQQEEPVLRLSINIKGSVLNFRMEFSRPGIKNEMSDKIFGNIQKQLKNQYEGLHQLKISEVQNNLLVEVRLPLYSGSLVNIQANKKFNEVPETV